MCNPHPNYMHITGYLVRHGDSLHFLWGKHLQCTTCFLRTKKTELEIVTYSFSNCTTEKMENLGRLRSAPLSS